jgi:hypothetical protein
MSINNLLKLISLFSLLAFALMACEINVPDPDADDDDDNDTSDYYNDDDDDNDTAAAEWKFEECEVYEGTTAVDCSEPEDYYNGDEWCSYYMCSICNEYNLVAEACASDVESCTTGPSADIINCYRDYLDCVMAPDCVEDMTDDEATAMQLEFAECADTFMSCSGLDSYYSY